MARIFDTQSPEITITNEELVAESAARIFEKLPLAYKRFAIFPDVWMVLGGLKAATDNNFLGDTFSDDDFKLMKEVFESEGIVVGEPQTVPVLSGNRRVGYIFNPRVLISQTTNNPYAPQYTFGQDIFEYIKSAIGEKYLPGGILGTIYSFPQSAIADFITSKKEDVQSETAEYGNETYWYIPPAKQDVIDREQKKRDFLSKILNNEVINKIMNSEELKNSDKEWDKRLPEKFRKKQSNFN